MDDVHLVLQSSWRKSQLIGARYRLTGPRSARPSPLRLVGMGSRPASGTALCSRGYDDMEEVADVFAGRSTRQIVRQQL
jgi:hypothetical protein